MKVLTWKATVTIIFAVLIGSYANVPNQINFQGTLTDSTGSPITDTRLMVFSIYNQESGGSLLWAETHTSIDIADGIFHLMLGSVTPIPISIFTGASLWLEITVEGQTLNPRTALATVPYGFKSAETDHATTADSASHAIHAETADHATVADLAAHATLSDTATWAIGVGAITHADTADYAFEAGAASTASEADHAVYSDTANFAYEANTANSATSSSYATQAGSADYAVFSDTAGYADIAAHADHSTYSDTANYAHDAGAAATAAEADHAATSDSAIWADSSLHAAHSDTAQFAAVSMPDADWTVNGDDIFHANGNVGIGTSTPSLKLDVNGTVKMTGFQLTGVRSVGDVLTSDENGVGTWQPPTGGGEFSLPYADSISGVTTAFWIRNDESISSGIAIWGGNGASGNYGYIGSSNRAIYASSDSGHAIEGFSYGSGFSGYFDGKMYASGNVGIGTEYPSEMLDVNGTAKLTGFKMPTGASNGYVLTSDGSGNGTWQAASGGGFSLPFSDSVDVAGSGFSVRNVSTHYNAIGLKGENSPSGNFGYLGHPIRGVYGFSDYGHAVEGYSYGPGFAGYFIGKMYASGNVGIGTETPSAKLDIRGTLNVGVDDSGHDVNFYGDFSGSRLFWNESKMALRVGRDSEGTNWLEDSTGTLSVAMGSNCKATGTSSVSLGSGNTASRFAATAMGSDCIASGSNSFALGYMSEATGPYAVAIGEDAIASGNRGITIGNLTSASGYHATSMGYRSNASGNYTFALGYVAVATGDYSMAFGRKVAAGPDSNAFVFGSGASDTLWNNTANSLLVGFDNIPVLFVGGSNRFVGIGTISPSYKLDVEGDIECTTLHETSDLRLKTDIQPLSDALLKIEQLQGISFRWNNEAESVGATAGDQQIGVVAQDVEAVFPELVSTPENGYKSVDYTKLTAVLIEAVKELSNENSVLKGTIQGLTERIEVLEKVNK